MKRNTLVLLVLLGMLSGCEAVGPAENTESLRVRTAPLGEPSGSFPNYNEMALLVLANRARCDPAADLAACSANGCADYACYTPSPPLEYNYQLNRVARFHSANLSLSGRGLQHDSPCDLVPDIATQYDPGPCDGSPSCACVGGVVSCAGVCPTAGDRLSAFGYGGMWGENAAPAGDPEYVFYMWLHENDADPSCSWRMSNGHRYNLLNPAYVNTGIGVAGNLSTHDFHASGTPSRIPSGLHFPEQGGQTTTFAFRANYYRAGGGTPTRSVVVIDGQCQRLDLERGTGSNGTYLYSGTPLAPCSQYFFLFEDADGQHRYPSDGSYHVGACAGPFYEPSQMAVACLGEVQPEETDTTTPADTSADVEDFTSPADTSTADDATSSDGSSDVSNSADLQVNDGDAQALEAAEGSEKAVAICGCRVATAPDRAPSGFAALALLGLLWWRRRAQSCVGLGVRDAQSSCGRAHQPQLSPPTSWNETANPRLLSPPTITPPSQPGRQSAS